MDVSTKSTGQLIDELVTNAFKTHHAVSSGSAPAEFERRYNDLRGALETRLGQDVAGLLHDLAIVSMATWQAQEVVMHESDDKHAASAGRQAQRLNGKRTRIIREIDRLLGETSISITTKTYG